MSENTSLQLPAAPAPAPQPPDTKPRPGVSAGFVILISTLVSVASSYVTWCAVRAYPPEPPQQVVVVDMAKLAVAKAFTTAGTGEETQAAAKKFLHDIDLITESYTKAGVLVINSQAAFNRPGTTDVTANYAKQLGVDLNKK